MTRSQFYNEGTSQEAYYKARQEGYSKELEEIACQDSHVAWRFAREVPGANIKRCQEAACKCFYDAYYFLINIEQADVLYCARSMVLNCGKDKAILKFLIQKYLFHSPENMELLKDEMLWKDYITKEMIDNYKIESILL